MAYNKIVFGNETLIDLTNDDVEVSDVLVGKKFHGRDGEAKVGECTFDADTSDADALANEILLSKTAYVNGVKLEGTMPNNGGFNDGIVSYDAPVPIPKGYHDGSGKVGIDSEQLAKLTPSNIKAGVKVLGVTGEYSGEEIKVQTKSTVPYVNKEQTILPDEGFDYLAEVKVAKISRTESDNSAGGTTITIGDVATV